MRVFSFLLMALILTSTHVWAQGGIEKKLAQPIHIIDAAHIKQNDTVYHLWGTELPPTNTLRTDTLAEKSLRQLIGRDSLTCFVYAQGAMPSAQCFNEKSTDISESIISKGFTLANRMQIVGTDYEVPYLNAQKRAQNASLGLWTVDTTVVDNFALLQESSRVVTLLLFAIFVVLVIVIIVATLISKRSMDRVYLTLNQTIQVITKEASIRRKEQEMVGVMLNAELKTNQSKIEAFLVIYKDLLKTLNDQYADHKYRRTGEVVRTAPALDRFIFDANVDKLEALDSDLAPLVIDFYGRIETNPDYNNLEPDMSHETAVSIVEEAVKKAQSLSQDIAPLIERFDSKGYTSVNLVFSN